MASHARNIERLLRVGGHGRLHASGNQSNDPVNLHTSGGLEGLDDNWNEDAVHSTTVLNI